MELKLKPMTVPTFEFKRVLPKALNGLGPDGCDEVFIHIRGKPAGPMNMGLASALESLQISAAIMDGQVEEMTDIAAAKKAGAENVRRVTEMQIGALYDHCVAEWKTNICGEDGEVLEPTRDNFIGLAGVRSEPIADAFIGFRDAIRKFTDGLLDSDEEALKN